MLHCHQMGVVHRDLKVSGQPKGAAPQGACSSAPCPALHLQIQRCYQSPFNFPELGRVENIPLAVQIRNWV